MLSKPRTGAGMMPTLVFNFTMAMQTKVMPQLNPLPTNMKISLKVIHVFTT